MENEKDHIEQQFNREGLNDVMCGRQLETRHQPHWAAISIHLRARKQKDL